MMLVTPSLSLVSTDSQPFQIGASFSDHALFQQPDFALVRAVTAISVYEVLP
jgi:hypothetical protein